MNMNRRMDNAQSKDDNEFREHLLAELEEILRYKWYLGEEMKQDPLESMSMDEICLQWINKYAEAFRNNWKREMKQKTELPADCGCADSDGGANMPGSDVS